MSASASVKPPGPYVVCITRCGQFFGWQIARQEDSKEIAHSAETFNTRLEALADSARVATAMVLVVDAEETETASVPPMTRTKRAKRTAT